MNDHDHTISASECDNPPTRRRAGSLRLRAAGWAVSFALVAAAILWAAWRTPADTVSAKTEIDAALALTVDQLMNNSGRPQDPASVREAAMNLVAILNPALTQSEALRDPAFLQEQSAAAASFFNPGAVHAQKMEDPAYRRQYEAAMQSFQRQAKTTDLPVKPMMTDLNQIEALRNDPAWLRQREESLRAAMEGAPPSVRKAN